jgi:hypothetical protein
MYNLKIRFLCYFLFLIIISCSIIYIEKIFTNDNKCYLKKCKKLEDLDNNSKTIKLLMKRSLFLENEILKINQKLKTI